MFESLEQHYQSSEFDQDLQLMMRECLVGSQITPRGTNGSDLSQESASLNNKFSFANKQLKNLKFQFQSEKASQPPQQKQQCVVDSIMNMVCTALVEAESKELMGKWLNKMEHFMRYIMVLSESVNQVKADQIYLKAMIKFSQVITFGFAFLFN